MTKRAGTLLIPVFLLAGATFLAARPAPPAAAAAPAEHLANRTYHIRYHKFDEVLAAVNERLSQRGEVSYRRAFQEIAVRDLEEILRAIDAVVREMDVPPRKVEVQITIFEASRAGTPNNPPDLMGGKSGNLRDLLAFTHFDALGTTSVVGLEGQPTSVSFERPLQGGNGYKVQVRIESVDDKRNSISLKPFELFRESLDSRGKLLLTSLFSTSLLAPADRQILVGGARSENAPRAVFCALRVRILE